jgi:hypothetical protein
VAKVLSLFSGSLASRVATRIVEQHPDVECVYLLYFRSPFSREFEDLRQLVKSEWPHAVFRTQSIKKDYRRLVELTDEGEFSLPLSCYNCRSLLLAKAARYMERIGAEYIVSGEVPGANELSAKQLRSIAENLGVADRVLRPLCVGTPRGRVRGLEKWLDREQDGKRPRSSNAVLTKLAGDVGLDVTDRLDSCNRCKLMTRGFGERVASLFGEAGFTLNALRLLDFPLYYKILPDVKMVLARDDWEKRSLQNLFLPQDLRVYPATPHGPMTLVRSNWNEKGREEQEAIVGLAARITATFAGPRRTETVPIYYRLESEDETLLLNASPFDNPAEIARLECVEMIPLAEQQDVLVG